MSLFKKEKKMVIVITRKDGMTQREIIGDDLQREERDFVLRDIERILYESK